jgi:chromosome segregation ATPase
MSNIYL